MKINVILYSDTSYEEFLVDSLEEIEMMNIDNKNVWIDIVGPYEEKDIIELGNYYDINSLVLRDVLEDELLVNPNKKILQDVYELKRNFIYIRKSLWSIRNMLNNVSLGDEIIDDKSMYYIKSVYNDVIQIIDLVETYREVCSGMLDTYLSSIGNKTNDVMKILTIVSTIFIPISFYSNLFMMNMKNIYSYIIFWGLSISTALCLLLYFRKKDWF